MRVELRTEAISDLIEAVWFSERQRDGLDDQFSDAMFAHLAYLETVAGGHEVVITQSAIPTRGCIGHFAHGA